MKKMILITTKNEVSVIDYPIEAPGDYMGELRGFYKAISCDCIEVVRPRHMSRFLEGCEGLVMVVDEEGLMNRKQINIIGSLFYGTPEHGSPIVGDILLTTEEIGFDGPALAGMEEERAKDIEKQLQEFAYYIQRVGVG